MSIELLKKKLGITGTVHLSSYNKINVQELLKEGSLICNTLIVYNEASFPHVWASDGVCKDTVYKEHLKKSYKERSRTWSTYRGLTSVVIKCVDDKLIVEVSVNEGDTLYGEYSSNRFKATCEWVSDNNKICNLVNDEVEDSLYNKAKNLRKEQIQMEEEYKIQEIKNNLLKEEQ